MSHEDDVIKEAERVLQEFTANLNADADVKKLLEAEMNDLAEQRSELMKKEYVIRAKLDEIARTKRDKYTAIRRQEQAVEDARRAKAIAEDNARLAELREANAAKMDATVANAEWQGRAKPHQFEAARFCALAKRSLLADSMGLGKTLEALMALDYMDAKRVLIICPGDVMSGFNKELEDWAKHRSAVTIGKMTKADRAFLLDMFRSEDQFTFILNYEAWYKESALLSNLISMRFDTVIVDEAHTIKELDGKPYKGVAEIIMADNCCYTCGGAKESGSYRCVLGHEDTGRARSVKNVMMMSGTFVLNSPTDIYASLHLVRPELFPDLSSFKRMFCRLDYDGKWVWQEGGEAALQRKINGFYLRRTRESAGVILPPQEIIVHEIELDEDLYPLQAECIRMLNQDAALKISEGRVTKMMDILALITRNRQAAVWPGGIVIKEALYDEFGDPVEEWDDKKKDFVQVFDEIRVGDNYRESVKMDKAVDLIRELNTDGHRVVVFSQFKEALKELGTRLGDRSVEYHGGTSDDIRQAVKRNFDRAYGEDAFWDNVLCHFKTGGVGLNLTAATAVVILDEEWNEGKNTQAYDRVNRMGQTENTQVHILRLTPGIDVWMAQLNKRKAEMVGKFNDAEVTLSIDEELRRMLGGK